MTPFERQQQVLQFLREQPGIKIAELAGQLGVSAGTIRNDLDALARVGQLARVRGGAVVKEEHSYANPSFAARAQVHALAKQRIARRAAELVEDGDSLIVDASTTAYALVPHLLKLRGLTVVTNGLSIAMALSQNPSHTVIVVGGVLRPVSDSVSGHLGGKVLEGLHIKTAFVSCSGFSLSAGMTEVDIHEVEIKRAMIGCAERVIALVDSSKFGKVYLSSFASLDQITHLITDAALPPNDIDQLRRTCTALTVCGENTASSFVPCKPEETIYKIGFACLSEAHPFATEVRRSLERAAQECGNIDLILADNRLDGQVALKVADSLIAQRVDLAIEYQIDEKVNGVIMDKFRQAGIPVIAVDIPMVGATFFGVDNYRAGYLAGVALGERIRSEWDGCLDALVVLEEPRAGSVPAARLHGQVDGLQEVLGALPGTQAIYLDSGNTAGVSAANVHTALLGLPEARRIGVLSFNDDTALGALEAARRLAREQQVLIVGQGADRYIRAEIRQPNARVVGASAYWPEKYGAKLIQVALRILRGEPVPPAVYIEPTFISSHNLAEHYPEAIELPQPG